MIERQSGTSAHRTLDTAAGKLRSFWQLAPPTGSSLGIWAAAALRAQPAPRWIASAAQVAPVPAP